MGATAVCKVSPQVREPAGAGDPRKDLPAQPMAQSPISLGLTLAENSEMWSRRLKNDGIQTLTHCWLGNWRPARLGQAELSQENGVLLACVLGCGGQQAEPTANEPSLIHDLHGAHSASSPLSQPVAKRDFQILNIFM